MLSCLKYLNYILVLSEVVNFIFNEKGFDVSKWLQTHGLKMANCPLIPSVLFTQKEQDDMSPDQQETIKHIKKSEMSKSVEFDLQIERFNGSKHPELPQVAARKSVLSLKVLAQEALARQKMKQTKPFFLS